MGGQVELKLHEPWRRVPFEEREWRQGFNLGQLMRGSRPQGAKKVLSFTIEHAPGATSSSPMPISVHALVGTSPVLACCSSPHADASGGAALGPRMLYGCHNIKQTSLRGPPGMAQILHGGCL